MRHLLAFFFVVLLSQKHASTTGIREHLQAKYSELAAAFAKQDLNSYKKVLAKDYILHVGKQTKDRDAVLKDFKKQMANMKNVKWVRNVTRVTKSNGMTVATVKSVFNGDFNMGGKMTHFWNSAVSVDSWVETTSKHWELKGSKLVSLDAKLDGKPAGHFPSSGDKHSG